MVFSYLLLGHLIGDFVLQTDKIAANKTRYWQWNLIHAIIVTFCMLAFAIPFGGMLCFLVVISGMLHFIFDYSKPLIAQMFHLGELAGFILDQLMNVGVILEISVWGNLNENLIFIDSESVDIFL
ncbi:MAG: DUF3307 domain-containing protein, partial [Clostridiales bacterium]|nr:DUF3307 domain-containing protein [Clostridiales bacterium]